MRCHSRKLCVERLEARAMLATLPAGFEETPVASGVTGATAMEFAPNGDLWVLEQSGAVKRFRPGSTMADVVGSVSSLGLNSTGERGLLGIAFDPEYATNKSVYLYYTTTTGGTHNRLSRFTVVDTEAADYYLSGTSTAAADAGSSGTPTQTVILDLNGLSATNHNGGAIHFGPDGKLYVAVGDNAVGSNAQSLDNLLGKILRINSDGTIPTDNPFYSSAVGQNRSIWALGLRNPFTFTFQPGTGRMFINDVGQSTWEEINDGAAGANYGWPSREGPDTTPPPNPFTGPVYAYAHGGGGFEGFAITGGAFYNPATQTFPAKYVGDYFYADFVNSWINVLDVTSGSVSQFATSASNPVDLRVTADGSLYYLARGSGQALRVRFLDVSFPYHNEANEFDVDDNGEVTPLDALLVINYLNGGNATNLPTPPEGVTPDYFYDVLADNLVAPLDALLVINHLNDGEGEGLLAAAGPGDEGESNSVPDQSLLEWLAVEGWHGRKRR